MFAQLAQATLYDWIGFTGFLFYVINYTLLSFRVLSGDSVRYYAINFTAASMVLFSLGASFNLASALIQVFWIVLSVIAITIRLGRRNGANRAATEVYPG